MENTIFIRVLTVFFCFLVICTSALGENKEAQIVSMWSVNNAVAGQPAVLWAQVDNTGDADLGSVCLVWFYVRGPGIDRTVGSRPCSVNDDLKSNSHTGVFSTGEGLRWYKVSWVPASAGDYTYWAVVNDGGKRISEWSNGQSFSVSATTHASAVVKSLWPVNNAVAGKAVDLWAQIDNTGDVGLGSGCQVMFYVRGPGVDGIVSSRPCSVNDDLKSNSHTGAFTPSEGLRWYKVSWTPGSAGSYSYWAIVDYNGQKISPWSFPTSFTVSQQSTQNPLDKLKKYDIRQILY